MTLEELKLAMRIDHNFDDGFIQRLKDTAEDYIKDAVTLSPNRDAFFQNNPKFDTAVMFLVGPGMNSAYPQWTKRCKKYLSA
ncbi:head-tail connector protein [Bacillus sp. S10C12M]|uniref:head-tail connector protein n=1 Tax=Bacillus sp. S10C12M TaxID=2918906 RepID=UPI00227FB238|nr:head-tail connector protein [Bacillus sp. S10C12M]